MLVPARRGRLLSTDVLELLGTTLRPSPGDRPHETTAAICCSMQGARVNRVDCSGSAMRIRMPFKRPSYTYEVEFEKGVFLGG